MSSIIIVPIIVVFMLFLLLGVRIIRPEASPNRVQGLRSAGTHISGWMCINTISLEHTWTSIKDGFGKVASNFK